MNVTYIDLLLEKRSVHVIYIVESGDFHRDMPLLVFLILAILLLGVTKLKPVLTVTFHTWDVYREP